MNKQAFVCLLSIFALTQMAVAASDPTQFVGDWTGPGVYQKGSNIYPCTQVEMIFNGTSATFTFAGGGRTCGPIQEPFQPENFTFADGVLSMSGQSVGTIVGNTLKTSFSFPDGSGATNTYSLEMTVEGQYINYHEELTSSKGGDPLISFVAIMQPKPAATK